MTMMLGFLVAALASFTAASTASAPEFQKNTVSSEGCGRMGISSLRRAIWVELKPILTWA
jgi:long-subunit fatty acid transport protein